MRGVRLAILALLFLVGLAITMRRPLTPAPIAATGGDLSVYQTMTARLRAGHPYYTVIGDELRRLDYATQEVFHWRTPLFLSGLARLPHVAAWTLLGSLALVLLALSSRVLFPYGPVIFWAGMVAQIGVLARIVVPDMVYLVEVWAGIVIAVSACLNAMNRHILSAGMGVASLFLREIAAPYCVVATLLAVRRRRWREVGIWIIGAHVYAVYFVWHAMQVRAHQTSNDLTAGTWAVFGGLPFLLATIRTNIWLLATPPVVTAAACVVLIAGLFSTPTPLLIRLSGAAYVAFFLIAGKPFDNYWGLIAWPTWALVTGFGLAQIRADLRGAGSGGRNAHLLRANERNLG